MFNGRGYGRNQQVINSADYVIRKPPHEYHPPCDFMSSYWPHEIAVLSYTFRDTELRVTLACKVTLNSEAEFKEIDLSNYLKLCMTRIKERGKTFEETGG